MSGLESVAGEAGVEGTGTTHWSRGYSARDIMGAIACALEEAAQEERAYYYLDEAITAADWFLASARAVRCRARNLAHDGYDVPSDIAQGLLVSGRMLAGCPVGTMRLDYLLCSLAERDPNWIVPLKRRMTWLTGARKETKNDGS